MAGRQQLIIAGSNKCGTTSVFRYLSEHPAVCPASRKETEFFFGEQDYASPAARAAFEALFPTLEPEHAILVEGTPNYLDGGGAVAARMRQVLQQPRLMFLLRDPVERFLSHYRSRQGLIGDPATDLGFEAFLADQLEAANAAAAGRTPSGRTDGHDLMKGRYVLKLREYLEIFDPDEIIVSFYEELAADSRAYMRRLCETLGVDPGYYDDFVFRVENRSRFHHSSRLRTLATRTNLRLEPLLNRVPAARRLARAAYNAVNTSSQRGATLDAAQRAQLAEYFARPNSELRDLLTERFPHVSLPRWLAA